MSIMHGARRSLLTNRALPVPLTLSGNEITPDTRAAGTQGDGLTGPYQGSSIGVWPATTNLVTNGGFETNTTGWATGGANTIARSTAQAKFGAASLLCTYQDNTLLASFGITLTAALHALSKWLYIPTSYDGTELTVAFTGFTSATGTLVATANLALRDQWQRVTVPSVTPNGGDLAGTLTVTETGTPGTAGRFIYIDGVQLEAQPLATPYVHTDGGTASRTVARVRFPTAGKFTTTQGWVVMRRRVGYPSTNRPSVDQYILNWASTSTERVSVYCSTSLFIDRVSAAGTDGTSQSLGAFAALDEQTLVAAWTSAAVKVSVNGAAFTSAAGTRTPTAAALTDIGSAGTVFGVPATMHSDMLFFAAGSGTLSNGDAAAIHNIARNNRIDSRLEDLPGGATFKWPSENWREGMAL